MHCEQLADGSVLLIQVCEDLVERLLQVLDAVDFDGLGTDLA